MYKQPTKGFLEQDHSTKSKGRRHKRRSQRNQENSKPNVPSITPKAVSPDTKAQLGAFALRKKLELEPVSVGKTDPNEKNTDAEEIPVLMDDNSSAPMKHQPKPPPSRDCPQTPVPRLALKDLVSIAEDGQAPPFSIAPDVSPGERIVWQVSPRGTPNPASQVTPAPKRQKRPKRARSSSPIGSPRVTPVSKKVPGLGSEIGKGFKTPQADPAHDVWQRYTNKSSNARPSGSAEFPPIARLFAANGANGLNLSPIGLRRSYSCGPDWPLVGAQMRLKRRRIVSAEDDNPDEKNELESFPEEENESEKLAGHSGPLRRKMVKSKMSRVSMLIEKVHEKLARGSTQPSQPSSSPIPGHSGDFNVPSSPTNRASNRRGAIPVQSPRKQNVPAKPDFSDNDEFDEFDGDIDMEMLDKVEEVAAAFTQQQQREQQFSAAEASTSPFPSKPAATAKKSFDIFDEESAARSGHELDEFDDEDPELYGIDVDNLVSKYSQAATVTSPAEITQKSIKPAEVVAEFDDIDFGNWDDDDLDSSDSVTDINSGTIRRYVVLKSAEGTWERHEKNQPQKIIQLRDEKSKVERLVYLREDWYYVNADEGDIVHVIGRFESSNNSCVIDNANNMLIVNPDFLVSSTTVADSFGCRRRAVLQDRVKASGDISKPLVYGSILHELFQKALTENNFSNGLLYPEIDKLLVQRIEELYILKEEVAVARDYVRSKVGLLQHWANLFMSSKPKRDAIAIDHRGRDTPNICINKVLDIEEHVWSPMYGLKGNIDATVQATVQDRTSERTLTVPLEMKTGKNSTAAIHRAQTMIYTLLLKDRYDVDIFCGLLYYMESSEIIRVPALRDELRGMIIARNELAWYAKNRDVFPPMLKKHACNSCFARAACFVYHKGLEGGSTESSGVEKQFDDITAHITDTHKKFLVHWDQLISKEEQDMTRFKKELWTMTSSEREKRGRCFGGLVIIPGSVVVSAEGSKINRFSYSLKKADNTSTVSFLESQIGAGEPIVISDEKGHFGLAMGFVTAIRKDVITVAVDRRLHNARMKEPGFDAQSNQAFTGIITIGGTSRTKSSMKRVQDNEHLLLRLDKDELSSGMALVRNNLVQLLSPRCSERTRELIIELREPVFRQTSTAYVPDKIKEQLNEDQMRAIEKVMTAEDYALILGMPGTGKTTTIAHIIRALVSQGRSVLLTSYTHTAVDNILLKIKEDGISTLRLGNLNKIHPEVKDFAILAETPRSSFKEINDAFMLPQVVGTTCLGINHYLFDQRVFEYCIVDEASQITLPVCLGPIRMAKKFILVGDHYQLPPLVRNDAAREDGLDVSLFKLLSDAHPNSVVSLEHQYRMCEEIMTLSNELIYDGRLKCGNEAVAQNKLKLPDSGGLEKFHSSKHSQRGEGACLGDKCWMKDLLNEEVKACFVNTDTVPAPQIQKGDRTDNPVEAELAFQLVEALISCGVPTTSIGVISVYRSQIKAIQHLLRAHSGVEMHTTDKFQGRDKDCIIISLVRSNSQQNIGTLLQDWRRINVAFTRARAKLIILGSKSTLCGNELLGKFMELMNRRGWVYDLPKDAHLLHHVPAYITQPSPVKSLRTTINDENALPTGEKGKREVKTGVMRGKALFGTRPILKDIAKELGI